MTSVGAFIAGIGLLVKQKLIDLGLVDELLGDLIVMTWNWLKPIAKNLKEEFARPFIIHRVEIIANLLESTWSV